MSWLSLSLTFSNLLMILRKASVSSSSIRWRAWLSLASNFISKDLMVSLSSSMVSLFSMSSSANPCRLSLFFAIYFSCLLMYSASWAYLLLSVCYKACF